MLIISAAAVTSCTGRSARRLSHTPPKQAMAIITGIRVQQQETQFIEDVDHVGGGGADIQIESRAVQGEAAGLHAQRGGGGLGVRRVGEVKAVGAAQDHVAGGRQGLAKFFELVAQIEDRVLADSLRK